MKPISSAEDLLLRVENANMPMHISSLTIYDPSTAPEGKVGFKDIMRYFSERLYRNKVFHNKMQPSPLGLGTGFWVDDPEFDIEFHVRHIALPKPGDWRQLCIQVARLHARHLDTNRPLWECYVIEGIDNIPGVPEGSFALFLKTHYAALNGGPGTQLLAALHELAPEVRASAPKHQAYFKSMPSVADMLLSSVGHSARWPLRLGRYLSCYFSPLTMYAGGKISDSAQWWLQVLQKRATPEGQEIPATLFNTKVSPHRAFEAVKFDLATIAKIRDVVPHATSNDVLISVIAGALRQYLGSKGALPPTSLIAEAPIMSRSEMRINSIRNLADSAVLAIHSEVADPLQRLQQVAQETRHNKKNFQSFLGKRLLIDAADLIPTIVVKSVGELIRRSSLISHLPPQFNTSISSIRGPDLPLYMSGAQMVGYYGMDVVHDLAALSHLICYFAGQATISVTACRKVLPDPAFYAQCLQQAFAQLQAAVEEQANVSLAATPSPVPRKSRKTTPAAARPASKRLRQTASSLN